MAASPKNPKSDERMSPDDRMAGSVPHDDGNDEDAQPPRDIKPVDDRVPPPAPTRQEDTPGTLHQDFSEIEPTGLILEGGDGGLGEDVWIGSDRADITRLLLDAPSITYFPVLQNLMRRLYLTQGRPEYLARGRTPEPGYDLLTLRLKKLEEMGLYSEATKMYSQIVDVPYHEHLARTGILSMMQGGKGSLGCLETRTVMNRFGEMEFWQMLNAVCDISLSRLAPNRPEPHSGLETNDIDLAASDSRILQRMAKDRSFSFRVDNQGDIASLSSLERAALQTKNAFTFSGFRFNPSLPVSPAAFGIMLGSRNLNESMQFIVLVKSASHGIKSIADIQQQYDLFKNSTQKPVGWRQLASVYKDAFNGTPGPAQFALISRALALSHNFGGPYAVVPFAEMLVNTPPSALPATQAEDAIRVMLAAGKVVPATWLQYFSGMVGTGPGAENRLFLLMAAELSNNLSTDLSFKHQNLRNIFAGLSERQKVLIAAAYEKLDKENKLHNYADSGVYEKLIGLTTRDDYVMPISDLTTQLADSFSQKKLGESILLSAKSLQGVRSRDLNPGLLQEVIGGMRAVGLTREARILAGEAVMGLSK